MGGLLVEQKVADFSTPYQFNGKELDAVTGLYNYGARYYDPGLSIWMGVDPLGDAPLNVNWSPYTYVWNNPINAIDPDGRHADWIKEENDDGSVTYIAEQGDSAESLEEQHGIPFEVGNAIIQGVFGENLPNGTPEGRSNIHPGDAITLSIVEKPSTQSQGGIMNWFKNLFSNDNDSRGGYAIFAHGTRSGWNVDSPAAGSEGSVTPLDISDMLAPGGGNSGKFMSGVVKSKFLIWEYNFIRSVTTGMQAYEHGKKNRPAFLDSILCPHGCGRLQDSLHIDGIELGSYQKAKKK